MSAFAGPSRLGHAARQVTNRHRHLTVQPNPLRTLGQPRESPTPGSLRLMPRGARGFATGSATQSETKKAPRYNFNTSLSFSEDPDPDHVNYRRVTAHDLARHTEPPTRVKMLVRDFIDDSLYNPHYGYFSRNATIFSPAQEEGYDFGKFRDAAAFQEAVAERYDAYATSLTGEGTGGLGRQVWHTPTELFKPYYARALTSAILATYKRYHYPDQDLIIYEVGAGNGSFMLDALRYIRDTHPEIYAKTQYRIIEISAALAGGQRARADAAGVGDRVEVLNEDVFRWQGGTDQACFVVALEVFDNFAHDMVRYDLSTLSPVQAVVGIDAQGDFSLLYEPPTDPLLRRVLKYRRLLAPSTSTAPPLHPALQHSPALRRAYAALPFAPNLTQPDFVPTKATLFLERLRERLPAHRLLVADFSDLPDAVPGRNGPVVQTRYGGSMVPCETFLVKQGYFDIFFPTDFALLKDTYSLIMNSPPVSSPYSPSSTSITPFPAAATPRSSSNGDAETGGSAAVTWSTSSPTPLNTFFTPHHAHMRHTGVQGFRRRHVGVHTHAEFLETYADKRMLDKTAVGDGTNVMLAMYGNARVMF